MMMIMMMMEMNWFVLVLALCIPALLISFYDLLSVFLFSNKSRRKLARPLPPGPPSVPFLTNWLWLFRSFSISKLESTLRPLHAKHGPVVSLRIGPRTSIFVASHELAHRALVQNGAVFADRPPPLPASRVLSSDRHNISSSAYGPKWRLFRRNLTSKILHPSRLPSYSAVRRRSLALLVRRFRSEEEKQRQPPVVVFVDHFRPAIFLLLALMCFGDDANLGEDEVGNIIEVQQLGLISMSRFWPINFFPPLISKVAFRGRWEELMRQLKDRESIYVPLIRNRARNRNRNSNSNSEAGNKQLKQGHPGGFLCYVDTLLDMELREEGNRKLTEGEMVSMCAEFFVAGTDTTTSALQWTMANLVKYPHVQERVYAEVREVMVEKHAAGGGSVGVGVEEEDLGKMPYLKAVTLESLRRHPPGHLVVPHSVTEEVELGGYAVPCGGVSVNFMVAEMGLDPKVWEDPLAFKPERFLDCGGKCMGFDLTGNRGIKMMPFGAGRRICPGLDLAVLHLEWFLANLVWEYEWRCVDGEEVDMSEKQELTVVMKKPLRAQLLSRRPKTYSL